MPLLFRESPLNSIWEGSGNVNALDVLRALSREPEALNAWIVEVGRARGVDPRLDRAIERSCESLADTADARGRRPPARRPDGGLPAGRAARAARARRGRRRVLRHPARHGVRRHARHPPPRHRPGRPIVRARPPRPPPRALTASRSAVGLAPAGQHGRARGPGRAGACRAARPRRPWCGRRRRRPACTSPWTARPPWWCRRGCCDSTSTISSATRSNSSCAEAAGGQRRRAEPDAGGVPGAVRVGRDRVAVGDHAGVEQRRLGLPAGQAERRDVEQHDVVVGAAGDQLGAARQEALGQRLGVVGDVLGVGPERRLPGLGERDGLGRHHVRERAAEHHRAAAVDRRRRTPRAPAPGRRAGRAATCGWWWW